jgi:hypothetical protein
MSVPAHPASVDRDAALNLDRLERIAAAARAELPVEYVAVLRSLPPGMRVRQAFALWRMARDALVRQGLRSGLTIDEATAAAARRLLAQHDDPST